MISLVKGQGVIWPDGRRFRVEDSWFSFDHHGHFGTGLHVFLTEIRSRDDDLPKLLKPDYFPDGPYRHHSRVW